MTSIGIKISGYEIVQQLGNGTSTTTFLARDDRGKQAVAKRLFDRLSADDSVCKTFLGASELSSKIRMKKHIAMVSSQKSSPEGVFLMREYVEGEPLSAALKNGQLDDPDRKRLVVLGLCDAVRSLASRGVVHGGIHPNNVIVQTDGRIKLTDFGIGMAQLAGQLDPEYPLHALRYLPGEQWQGKESTASSDIYAIGLLIAAVLYQNGDLFDAQDRAGLEQQILAGIKFDCPVIAAAIDRNASRRYPKVDKFREGLIEKHFPPVEPVPDTPKKKKKRKPGDGAKPQPQPVPQPPIEPPPPIREPAHAPSGALNSIYDVKSAKELPLKSPSVLCKVPASGLQQLPFQISNSGPGRLQVDVRCVGNGISASPAHLNIATGRTSPVIINSQPDADQFTDVVFQWQEENQKKSFTVKLHRSG